jgi:hypothetical protein
VGDVVGMMSSFQQMRHLREIRSLTPPEGPPCLFGITFTDKFCTEMIGIVLD